MARDNPTIEQIKSLRQKTIELFEERYFTWDRRQNLPIYRKGYYYKSDSDDKTRFLFFFKSPAECRKPLIFHGTGEVFYWGNRLNEDEFNNYSIPLMCSLQNNIQEAVTIVSSNDLECSFTDKIIRLNAEIEDAFKTAYNRETNEENEGTYKIESLASGGNAVVNINLPQSKTEFDYVGALRRAAEIGKRFINFLDLLVPAITNSGKQFKDEYLFSLSTSEAARIEELWMFDNITESSITFLLHYKDGSDDRERTHPYAEPDKIGLTTRRLSLLRKIIKGEGSYKPPKDKYGADKKMIAELNRWFKNRVFNIALVCIKEKGHNFKTIFKARINEGDSANSNIDH